jgi:acetylornithine deacetylase
VKNETLALLFRLISINSVFPHEGRLAKFCAGYLEKCGFEVQLEEFSKGRFNVVAQKGKKKGSILLSGHLDTVPPYNYKRNPFRALRKNGKIFGLGSWDMKAGIALILLCAKYCKASKRGIRIVLTADEENISEGTWFALRRGAYRGCAFAICHEIPDAQSAAVEGRPPIILGRRGRAVYQFAIKGIGAHGAGAGGVSAIGLAAKLAAALESIPMPSGKMGPCRLFVRKFVSESTSLSVPTEAVVEADVHYVPPYTKESFLAYIKKSLASLKFPKGCKWDASIAKRSTPYLDAYIIDASNPFVERFLSSYEKNIGRYGISYGLTVADENIIAKAGIPVVTLGLEGGEAHSSGEWVSEKDFLLLAEKMPRIVDELLA